jgi:hypothetical protein
MNGMENLYGRADVRVENRPVRRLDGLRRTAYDMANMK